MHAHHRSHSHRAEDAEKVHVLDAAGSSDTVAETTIEKKQKDKRKGQRNSGTSRGGGNLSLADAHTHFASAPSLSSTPNKGKLATTANLAYVLAPSIQLDEGLSASGTEINFGDEDEETDSEAQDQLGDIDGRISRQRSVVAAVVASSSLFFAPSGSASDSSGASCLVPLKTGNEILLKEFSETSETFDDSQDEMDLLSLYNASSRPMSMEILSSSIKDALAIEPPISTSTELEETFSQRPSQCPTPKARTASISTEITSHPGEDRTSITSGLSGSSPSSGVPRYLVKESWDASGRSSMEPSPNIKNPMRVRHSFMSTVSSASSAPSIPSKFACSDKSIGPFWISLDMVHKLASEMDFSLFSRMDFRAVGSDSEFDEEDDYGLVTRGPGIDLSKQFVEPVFEQEDGVVSIKSGSLHSLVTYLWANIGGGTDQNQRLMVEFLQTYRYFATSEDVARLLALSYMEIDWSMDESDDAFIHSHSEFLENLSVGVCSGTNKDWSGILQLRILNVFKKWIDLHPDDFTANKELLEFTTLFFEKMVEKDEKRAMHGSSIVGNLRDKVRESELNKYLAIPALPSLTCSRGHKSAPNLSLAKSRTQSEGPPTTTSGSTEQVGPTLKPSSWNLRRKFSFRGSSSKSTDTLASIDTEKVAAPSSSPFNLNNIFHSRTASAQPSLQQTQEHGAAMSITAALAAISPPTRRLSELDPTSVAKQLTLLEHNHFRKIKIDEFFMQSWSKKKDGGVGANAASKSRLVTFINWFNRVAYGIATEVVKLTVLKERVVMLKRLIFVAEICVKWNNFNTAFEIVAGLNLGPVSRLAKTWKAMPAKYMDAWNKLNRIVSSESSYRTYRQLIAQIKEQGASIPVLPYLGVNLSDLTFTEDGNPTYVTNDECSPGELIKIINFSKFKMISKLLSGILKFQSGQYDFEYDEHVQRWLRTEWEAASSKELYEMSLLCEPRIVST